MSRGRAQHLSLYGTRSRAHHHPLYPIKKKYCSLTRTRDAHSPDGLQLTLASSAREGSINEWGPAIVANEKWGAAAPIITGLKIPLKPERQVGLTAPLSSH